MRSRSRPRAASAISRSSRSATAEPPAGGEPVWVLADDRPGHTAQAIGVAEALGKPFRTLPLAYGPLARLSGLLGRPTLAGLDGATRALLAGPPWPRLVIAAGRRTVPVARWIARASGGATRLVQIMDPGTRRGFDLIAIPAHDRPAPHPAVIETLGAPHRIHAATLAAAAERWAQRAADLPQPRIAVLVGGATRHAAWPADWAAQLAAQVERTARDAGGSILVTTSRRTPEDAVAALMQAGTVPGWRHRWAASGENPYVGMLALADALVVTADSASMLTEACATGRPVRVFGAGAVAGGKLGRLIAALKGAGRVRDLGEPIEGPGLSPLRPQDDVAAAIVARGLA